MRVKICGLTTSETLTAAVDAGAAYVGFVFFEPSPRHLEIQAATILAQSVLVGVCKTALVVNADDATLDSILGSVPIDMIQLHGEETPERVAQIKDQFGLPVMKAVGIADESDLPALLDYSQVADQILVDAKPPKDATLPGGNGLAFDWRLIANRRWATPWMLAGGLTPQNVGEAVRLTGARQIDVSSGVEASTGVKDIQLISDFIRSANGDA
jgi:phosphoribosylanthranilate isomerase